MKKLFLLAVFTAFCGHLFAQAQEKPPKKLGIHTAYADVGGVAGLYSLNYERTFYTKRRFINFGVGGGFSTRGPLGRYGDFLALIGHGSVLMHVSKSGSAEIGINPALIINTFRQISPGGSVNEQVDYQFAPIPHVGYRYQKGEGGLFFRSFLTIVAEYFVRETFETSRFKNLWLGISIGYTFPQKS